MPFYAAYGSNLDPEQMAKRAPHSPLWGTGWLEGWRLAFGGEDLGWDGSLVTVCEDPDQMSSSRSTTCRTGTSHSSTPGRARTSACT